MNCTLLRSSKSPSRTGSSHPHEVPACFSDHHVEIGCLDVFDMSPIVAKGLFRRVHTFRQLAPAAQEHGMQLHARPLLQTITGATSGALVVGMLNGLSGKWFTLES